MVNLHWNASLKFATFLGPFRVEFWRENASASRLAWRAASRTLDEPVRASAMRFASWTFFSSVKNRISRKSKGYPTCRLLNSPRVKSSLALYNLSKRIERPLLISPNDWNKLHSQGIRRESTAWNRESKTVLDYSKHTRRHDGKSIPHSRSAILKVFLPYANFDWTLDLRKSQPIREWERWLSPDDQLPEWINRTLVNYTGNISKK